MNVFNVKYYNADKPDQRWTVGILSDTREDCIETIAQHVGFRFAIESIDASITVHGISNAIEKRLEENFKKRFKVPLNAKPPVSEPEFDENGIRKIDTETEEEKAIKFSEVECICGKVYKNATALKVHERSCKVVKAAKKEDEERRKAEENSQPILIKSEVTSNTKG